MITQAPELQLQVGGISQTGGRPNNEDAILVQETAPSADLPNGGWVLAVADGMGGHADGEMASKLEASVKGMVNKSSNLFEALNLRYFGPVDGHNITNLVDTLKDMRNIPASRTLRLHLSKHTDAQTRRFTRPVLLPTPAPAPRW